jgi:hypothetical protein
MRIVLQYLAGGIAMAKTKTKSGPKPSFGEPMDFRITVIVTKAQAKIIQSVAAADGRSASSWARKVLLAAIPKEVE